MTLTHVLCSQGGGPCHGELDARVQPRGERNKGEQFQEEEHKRVQRYNFNLDPVSQACTQPLLSLAATHFVQCHTGHLRTPECLLKSLK